MEQSAIIQTAPTVRARGLRGWLAGFRRITTTGNYIAEIDGLRFIAIFAVILHHVALYVTTLDNRPEGVFELGTRGVELFMKASL